MFYSFLYSILEDFTDNILYEYINIYSYNNTISTKYINLSAIKIKTRTKTQKEETKIRKNTKILTAIIAIIIIILSYQTITAYQNQQEQDNFYNTIQNTSQIENQSDTKVDTYRNQSTITTSQLNEITALTINTTTQEIDMLEELYNNTNNETLKNYTQIEIDRLTAEKHTYEFMQRNSIEYDQYKNGQIGSSKALSEIKENNKQISTYANMTDKKKIEAEEFLNHHQDIKQKFNQLNIDEDFMINQLEKDNISYVK